MVTIEVEGDREARSTCRICAKIADFAEIDNPQDPSEKEVFDDFADEVKELVAPNPGLESFYQFESEKLLKCPFCGTYYRYRRWAPGGSEDVMKTYIHESITRIGFLAAHKELHAALYKSSQRAQEYGGQFLREHDETAKGVQHELQLLRHRYREIVSEAISLLENKHEYSLRLSELAAQFLPHTGQRQVEEARQREEEVARYHARILVEYLQYYDGEGIENDTARRMAGLLADDNELVRSSVLTGLVQALGQAATPQPLAAEISNELEKHEPLYPEAQEMLEVCQAYSS